MKYGYCDDCMNKGCCNQCYRGSHYESAITYAYNHGMIDDNNSNE